MIVIGLGSGRSGTASLAQLLDSQTDALCFHEMNPSCVRFAGTPRPIFNTIQEFQAVLDGGDPGMLTVDLSRRVNSETFDRGREKAGIKLIGDVAFYYLNYVRDIARSNGNVRFVCLRRGKEETIESWMRKSAIDRWPSKRIADRLSAWILREPYHESYNFWMEHDGTIWRKDDVWDKCFPKFNARDKREAISLYYDLYYDQSCKLEDEHSGVFRIFSTDDLNDDEGREGILSFCGIARGDQVHNWIHAHKSTIS